MESDYKGKKGSCGGKNIKHNRTGKIKLKLRKYPRQSVLLSINISNTHACNFSGEIITRYLEVPWSGVVWTMEEQLRITKYGFVVD